MENNKNHLHNVLLIIMSIFPFGLAIISVIYNYFYKWNIYLGEDFFHNKNILIFLCFFLIMAVAFFSAYLIYKYGGNKRNILNLCLVLGITFVIRFIIVSYLKTEPISDFLRVYNYASLFPMNKESDAYIQFYENALIFPYYGIESLTMRLILNIVGRTVFNAQMINVCMSCVVSVVLFKIGLLLFDNGYKAVNIALLYTFLPSAILSDTFLAHENYNIFFSAFFLFFILKLFKSKNKKDILKYGILAGCSLGILNLYKPVKIIYLLAILCAIFMARKWKQDIKKNIMIFLILILTSSIVYKTGIFMFEQYIGAETKTLASRSVLIGLDLTERSEQWSLSDLNNLFREYVETSDSNIEINMKVFQYLKDNWKNNPDKIIPSFIDRFIEDWGNEEGYAYWAFQGITESQKQLIDSCNKGIIWIIDIYMIILYIGTIMACFVLMRKNDIFVLFNIIIISLFFLMLLIIEAQARYKSIFFVSLCIGGGYGLSQIFSLIKERGKK